MQDRFQFLIIHHSKVITLRDRLENKLPLNPYYTFTMRGEGKQVNIASLCFALEVLKNLEILSMFSLVALRQSDV